MGKVPEEVSEYLSKIGRRGGKIAGVEKGFAAMDKERLRTIAKAAAQKRWKNNPKKAAKPKAKKRAKPETGLKSK